MPSDNPPVSPEPGAPLREVRFSLAELLHEVEHERRNSMLGMEMVEQNEIRTIFKSRSNQPRPKKKST